MELEQTTQSPEQDLQAMIVVSVFVPTLKRDGPHEVVQVCITVLNSVLANTPLHLSQVVGELHLSQLARQSPQAWPVTET